MSAQPVSPKLAVVESSERSKNAACEVKEPSSKKKIAPSESPMERTREIASKATKMHEAQRAKSTKDKDDKAIPRKAPEESPKGMKSPEVPEVTKVRETLKKESPKDKKALAESPEPAEVLKTPRTESPKDIKDEKLKALAASPEATEALKMPKIESTKNVKSSSEISPKESNVKDVKPAEDGNKTKIPKITKTRETLKTEPTKNVKDDKSAIATKESEEICIKNIKPAEAPEPTEVHETLKKKSPEDIKDDKLKVLAEGPELVEVHETLKKKSPEDIKDDKLKVLAEGPELVEVHETLKKESPEDIKDDELKVLAKGPELAEVHETLKKESPEDIKDDELKVLAKSPELVEVHETLKKESPEDIKDDELKVLAKSPELPEVLETLKTESPEDINNDKVFAENLEVTEALKTLKIDSTEDDKKSSEISPQDLEESNVKDKKPVEDEKKTKKIPVLDKNSLNPWDLGARKIWRPLSSPNLDERPLVLATHLTPSLPIELFEVFAEIIEDITKKPVVLLYESRFERPVATDVTDIAILPAANNWDDGVLLPVSFWFEHHLNWNESPCVFVDIIVADDRAPHVETIMDLRGHRCAIPSRCDKLCSATSLLFNDLHSKGESPAFFGNILDGISQVDVLRMVAGKQAEVGVLEAPVISCHKSTIMGAESLQILATLGPLPPYRIMINKALVNTLFNKLAVSLLDGNQPTEWIDRLSSFGIAGFVENCPQLYNRDMKYVARRVPYY